MKFVSRGGQKLDHALSAFNLDVKGWTVADLGCSTGGFVDCLLGRGAAKVYAVDTGYGVLDFKLRKDSHVVVMERQNAMHVELPELVDLVTIDVGWTRQRNILPAAKALLKKGGGIVTLVKPHYEAAKELLRGGVLPESELDGVLAIARTDVASAGLVWGAEIRSPIKGSGGNIEVLAHLRLGL